MKIRLIFIAFLLMYVSCKSSVSSRDFTKEWEFTKGIEGPATDSNDNIYVVNYKKEGTIGIVNGQGEASLLLELPAGSIGNGIRFFGRNMFIADYTNHNILRFDMLTREMEVFVNLPNANQPNDITISQDANIYASDPNWSEGSGRIWIIRKDRSFEILEDGMGTTNGIEVSIDGKKLYVNESVQRKIWVYDIGNNGNISNKKLFYSFDKFGLDGMRCDRQGNLYVCRYDKGSVIVISPNGKIINEFRLKGKKPSNITFNHDYSKAYITMADRGCLEVIDLI